MINNSHAKEHAAAKRIGALVRHLNASNGAKYHSM